MAPQNAVTAVAASVSVDPHFVEAVAASLRLPSRSPKQVVEDLLARLSQVKRRRELRGLNHWEEYAPGYLRQLAARHERLRVRAIEEFFRAEKSKALARALYALGDPSEAEDAVGEACLKLLAGKAGPAHFYRVLKLVCVDKLRSRYSSAKLFSRRRDLATWDDESVHEPACAEIGGGDPLAILLHQEDIREGIRDVKTKRKHRQTRDLDWWKELISFHCPEEVVGKWPPQTNM